MKKDKETEEIQAFIIFGDINRSMAWLRRPTSQREKKELLNKIRDQIDRFESKYKYQMKRTADGFISVTEIVDKHKHCQAANILSRFYDLGHCLNRIIKQSSFPRPDGYRIRFVVGTAFKEQLTKPDGFISYDACRHCVRFKQMRWFDFIGYSPHLCHRLLSVMKDTLCIVHESIKDLLNSKLNKRYGFIFTKIDPPPPAPDEVDEEDMRLLWTFNRTRRTKYVGCHDCREAKN